MKERDGFAFLILENCEDPNRISDVITLATYFFHLAQFDRTVVTYL